MTWFFLTQDPDSEIRRSPLQFRYLARPPAKAEFSFVSLSQALFSVAHFTNAGRPSRIAVSRSCKSSPCQSGNGISSVRRERSAQSRSINNNLSATVKFSIGIVDAVLMPCIVNSKIPSGKSHSSPRTYCKLTGCTQLVGVCVELSRRSGECGVTRLCGFRLRTLSIESNSKGFSGRLASVRWAMRSIRPVEGQVELNER